MGYVWLGDKVTKIEISLMSGCFLGVVGLALAKGGFFDDDISKQEEPDKVAINKTSN